METRTVAHSVFQMSGDDLTPDFRRILVIQTAFLGDVILTLPLVQKIKETFPGALIDVVVTPRAAGLFGNHPAVSKTIAYDKRGRDRGIAGFLKLRENIGKEQYDVAVVPHRSIRSALLARMSGIPLRIGFDRSTGRILFTHVVRYRSDRHEIERNLSLLTALGVETDAKILPSLYPGEEDRVAVDRIIQELSLKGSREIVAIAPGTIWNTKRWLMERFADVSKALSNEGLSVVLIGSESDRSLCEEIRSLANNDRVRNTAGTLNLLQSVELIRRSRAIISNDSAPMHMAVAVRTPVVAIFGATIPAFGFGPYGEHDVVVETLGLKCRPCSVHGGSRCPIGTFDCMQNIHVDRVVSVLHEMLKAVPPH